MTTALVVGAGSVGRRHARNLAALGFRIAAADPRADRLDELAGEVDLVARTTDVAAALADPGGADAVVVASPPAFHVDQALAAAGHGLPVLLEKPLAPDLADGTRLAGAGAPVLLGYTWRWWPALVELRRRVLAGDVGRVLHVSFTLSAHLADWHPWEPVDEWFMASAELGGGALLDESHWIDLLLWLLGDPSHVFADIDRLSDLDIDTDDHVDLLARYADGTRASLHLDLYGRPHEKSIRVSGDAGTIRWAVEPNELAIGHGVAATFDVTPFPGERNDMFVAEARSFVDVVRGDAPPACTVEDGLRVLRVIDAARRSAAEGRLVAVTP